MADSDYHSTSRDRQFLDLLVNSNIPYKATFAFIDLDREASRLRDNSLTFQAYMSSLQEGFVMEITERQDQYKVINIFGQFAHDDVLKRRLATITVDNSLGTLDELYRITYHGDNKPSFAVNTNI